MQTTKKVNMTPLGTGSYSRLVKAEKDVPLDITKSTSTTSEVEGESHQYDSLKVYREGPNTESGELDPKFDSKDVKKHNKSVADRNVSR